MSRLPACVRRRSAALGLCLAACSSDPTSPGGPLPECTGPVTIEVSSGTSPSFDWSPACRLFFLIVELGADDQWLVITDGANAIAPPVLYGVLPAGARRRDPAIPLEAGRTYDVNVARWTGPGAEDGVLIGSRDFTP